MDAGVEHAKLEDTPLYVHMLVIISEHDDYDTVESIARDAESGDARLRSWSTGAITTNDLVSDDERDFFGVWREDVGSPPA